MRCRIPLTVVLTLVLTSCAGPPAVAPPGTHTGGPATADEKKVAEMVLAAVEDPASVAWERWGPHDEDGSTHFHDPKLFRVIRVRYTYQPKDGPRSTADSLYDLDDRPRTQAPGVAAPRYSTMPTINLQGDGWWAEARRAKLRQEDRARRGPGS